MLIVVAFVLSLQFAYFLLYILCSLLGHIASAFLKPFGVTIDFGPYFDHNKCSDHHCDICTSYGPVGVGDPLTLQFCCLIYLKRINTFTRVT